MRNIFARIRETTFEAEIRMDRAFRFVTYRCLRVEDLFRLTFYNAPFIQCSRVPLLIVHLRLLDLPFLGSRPSLSSPLMPNR